MTLDVATPEIAGDWIHLYDPNLTRTEHQGDWYTNDHCFIQDQQNNWHAFGITGWRPPDCWANEQQIFHCSGSNPLTPGWTEHDYALVNDNRHGERYLWAPHIIDVDGRYYMFYAGGNLHPDAEQFCAYCGIHMAWSDDLFNWQRHERNPLFVDCGNARDPFVMAWNGRYYLYYTRTFNEMDHRSCIAMRESPDLVHWSGPEIVHVQPEANHWAGDAESAMIVPYGDKFYLFLCLACTGYHVTRVYVSETPTHFAIDRCVTELESHASEILDLGNDQWAISTTGWDRQGLFAAPLKWK
jgi:hypothetical protein